MIYEVDLVVAGGFKQSVWADEGTLITSDQVHFPARTKDRMTWLSVGPLDLRHGPKQRALPFGTPCFTPADGEA